MFISFGSRLRRGFSFRLGWRMRGPAALITALVAFCFYLMWWTMLATAYLCYGMVLLMWWFCKLVFWYPVKALLRVFRKHKRPEA